MYILLEVKMYQKIRKEIQTNSLKGVMIQERTMSKYVTNLETPQKRLIKGDRLRSKITVLLCTFKKESESCKHISSYIYRNSCRSKEKPTDEAQKIYRWGRQWAKNTTHNYGSPFDYN